jgi:hypothetical protein
MPDRYSRPSLRIVAAPVEIAERLHMEEATPPWLASTRVVYDEVPIAGREPGEGAQRDRPSVILRKFSSN